MAKELTFKTVRKKYLYASYYCADGRLEISTGLTTIEGKESKSTTQKKNRLKYLVETYAQECSLADRPVLINDVTRIISDEINKVRKVKSSTVYDLFSRYCDIIFKGEILNGAKPYSDSVKGQLKAVKVHLKQTVGNVQINQFKESDFTSLKTYYVEHELAQNSVSVYIRHLLTFFKRTHKLGWHSNAVYLNEDIAVAGEDIDTHVYLSIEEIEAIRCLPLTNKRLIGARDFFVFGCYTGMRHSDLSNIENAQTSNDIIAITLKKRKVTVHVPMGKIIKEIWDKYDGKIPVRADSRSMTNRIKSFCREAKINAPTLYTYTKGGKTHSQIYEKWELIGTHTMRRSFATNAYKAGVPSISIMKITGHKTESQFMKYIRISGEENAELMKSHPFFK